MAQRNTHSQAPTRRAQSRRAALFALCFVGLGLSVQLRPLAGAEPAQAFVVIVHAGNPISSTTREFVADAFLKRTARWHDGQPIRPADLEPDSAARLAFSKHVLRRSVVAVRRYWQQRIFSGRELPPPELDSDDAMVRYVESARGAIGYVSSNARLTNAKVIPVR